MGKFRNSYIKKYNSYRNDKLIYLYNLLKTVEIINTLHELYESSWQRISHNAIMSSDDKGKTYDLSNQIFLGYSPSPNCFTL